MAGAGGGVGLLIREGSVREAREKPQTSLPVPFSQSLSLRYLHLGHPHFKAERVCSRVRMCVRALPLP